MLIFAFRIVLNDSMAIDSAVLRSRKSVKQKARFSDMDHLRKGLIFQITGELGVPSGTFYMFFIVCNFQACMNLDFLWGTFLVPISQAPAVLQLSLAIFELCDLQP